MFSSRPMIEPLPAPAIFSHLTDDERRALAPYLQTQHHPRGTFLFHVGEVAEQLFWIHRGIVKISALTHEGSERLLNIFWPGDLFGMICVSDEGRRLGVAQAVAPVSVLTSTNTGLAYLLRLRPDLATIMLQDLLDQ